MDGSLRETLKKFLREGKFAEVAAKWGGTRKTVRYLRSLLYDPQDLVRWRAVTMLGWLSTRYPDLIRPEADRLIWSLNDESGSIGRGAPEALGEIARNNPDLVRDGVEVLIHYIEDPETCRPPNRNLEILTGAIWAVGRIGERYPERVQDVLHELILFLEDPDSGVRGHSAWSLGMIRAEIARKKLEKLLNDPERISLYEEDFLKEETVGRIAAWAVERIRHAT